jgi:hypothetical protein
MRIEMANFVDNVGPELRRKIRERLRDPDYHISDNALAQYYRLVLDTVKLLDRGEGDYEPPGYTDEELEKLLGEGTSEEDA